MATRRGELPVEDSWRVVDGDHDSFDTSVLPSLASEDEHSISAPHSSGQPSSGFPSQLSSQGTGSLASQDSIRDFARHQEDDHNILLEPFRPSVPSARDDRGPPPASEFTMPKLSIAGMQKGDRSRRTQGGHMNNEERPRRRGNRGETRADRQRRLRYATSTDDEGDHLDDQGQRGTLKHQLAEFVPAALLHALLWAFDVLILAFRYIQRPLALLLAIYIFFGGLIVTQNMVTKSIYASLSPACRIPGVSYLGLPFCPSMDFSDVPISQDSVEFDDLMGVQSKFEQVLEHSAEGASLPMEMKRSETNIRDLRTLVRHSELQSKDELVLEFDGYIDTVRIIAADLQKFNMHVGSAVDAVISINRWTSRFIDGLASSSSSEARQPSDAAAWATWFFYPFQPSDAVFDERLILDKYIEHTSLVSERIRSLILEAQGVLRLLTKAEDHLALIFDISHRTKSDVSSSKRDDVLWTILTILGFNKSELRSQQQQLSLLRRVDIQRSDAVKQLSSLILELESIQAGLDDLRDRVAAPNLLSAHPAKIPLSVHIETIDRGVERLDEARRRISDIENDKVKDTLARGGVKDERWIEGRR